MPSIMSMEDLFYGPPEATWILPTREDAPLRRYRDQREFSPPRRFLKPEMPPPRYDLRDGLRPAMARPQPQPHELRPIERLARVHTVPEPVPVTEEIRKVVEMPVPTPVAPPTQVVVAPPPAPAPVPAPAPRVQVVPRTVSPPRAIVHHPIEMKVPMCCEKCAKKVRDRLESLEGVESVIADQYNQKVVVYGRVNPERVLERVRLVKKRSAFWDMTVDYSDNYRRARHAEAEAVARESAKKVEAAKALVAPVAPPAQVVVNLPQEHHAAPKVTAVLPQERERPGMPFVVDQPRVHNQRFVSPPRAYRHELFHGPAAMQRRPEFYNGRHSVY